jgi:hypothetical protein
MFSSNGGVYVNAGDGEGRDTLHVRWSQVVVFKLVTFLIHNGANGDAKTAWSLCVSDICIRYNWAMMASFLLELEE